MAKVKLKYRKDESGRCIVGVVILPDENGLFIIYVGWEYENSVKGGYVKFYKSNPLSEINQFDIRETCDFGRKMSEEEIKKIFPQFLIQDILNA